MTEEQIKLKELKAIKEISIVRAVKCIVILNMPISEACEKNDISIAEVEKWMNGINNLIPKASPQSQGARRSSLMRYKAIKELYDKHKTADIPDTVILRKYIRPIYAISRTTLYKILTTSINKELAELDSPKNEK